MPRRQSQGPKEPRRTRLREVIGLALATLGVVSLLALASASKGALADLIALVLRRLFGWGAFAVGLAFLGGGVFLLWRDLSDQIPRIRLRLLGIALLFLIALALSHLASAPAQRGRALAAAGRGGGYSGWALGYALEAIVGRPLAFIILGSAGIAALWLALQLPAKILRKAGSVVAKRLSAIWHSLLRLRAKAPASVRLKPPPREARLAVPAASPQMKPSPETPFVIEAAPIAARTDRRRRKTLPPLELLEPEARQSYDEAELRQKAEIIEQTLQNFGVPVRVVECRHGPTVTQFGLEPGYIERRGRNGDWQQWRVRINKITALANDLSLALAASPIRIEAPVPGRGVVGIEVPNSQISVVSLRGVMESPEFTKLRAPLKIALGRDVAGYPLVADLGGMPHLLIAGATGSGKSVCINSLICCLLMNHTPDTLRLILIDPKRVELTHFREVPHLLGSVLYEVEEVIAAIKWVSHEMERRYRLFSHAGARHLEAFNRKAARLGEERLPFIVIFIDELAELMMVSPEEVERYICRIAQLARATGIHLVMATQRPSVDVVTGLIKANFPARICFATTSQVDSRVVLDAPGAEKLLGRGDMLFMSPTSSGLVRGQGCLVTEAEMQRLANFWRDKRAVYLTADEAAPWGREFREEEDALLAEAIDLVQRHQQASASFLQRRLRIGYPRAARLMDLLEEKGIIGPPVAGGRSRQVLRRDDRDR